MRLVVAFAFFALYGLAQDAGFTGDWLVTLDLYGSPTYVRWKVEQKNGHYTTRFFGFNLDGTVKGDAIEFTCTQKEDGEEKPCGKASATRSGDEMRGAG